MAKKKPDYSTAGLSILGVKPEQDQEFFIPDISSPVEPPELGNLPTKNIKPSNTKVEARNPSKFISRTYYITPEQHKALKLRAASSDDPNEKDISAIVRAALDRYLSNEY